MFTTKKISDAFGTFLKATGAVRAMMYIALFVCLTACGGWSKRDTMFEAACVSVTAYDWHQTEKITAAGDELNTWIGPTGNRMSPSVYFPTVLALHTVVSMVLPRGWLRTSWQAATLGVELQTIWSNERNFVTDPNLAPAKQPSSVPPASTSTPTPTPCFVCTAH